MSLMQQLVTVVTMSVLYRGKVERLALEQSGESFKFTNLKKLTGFGVSDSEYYTIDEIERWMNIVVAKGTKQKDFLAAMKKNLIPILRNAGIAELVVEEDKTQQLVEEAVKEVIQLNYPLSPVDCLSMDLIHLGLKEDWIMDYYINSTTLFYTLDKDCNKGPSIFVMYYQGGRLLELARQGYLPEVLAFRRNPRAWQDARVSKLFHEKTADGIKLLTSKRGRRGEPWFDSRFVAEIEDKLRSLDKIEEQEMYKRIQAIADLPFDLEALEA